MSSLQAIRRLLSRKVRSGLRAYDRRQDEDIVYAIAKAWKIVRCRLIASWGWRSSQGFGCSPMKAVRELGLDRRETGRSLSGAGAGDLRGFLPSTRGLGGTNLWCASCRAYGSAG